MTKRKKSLFLLLLLPLFFLLPGCTKPVEDIKNFDEEAWKADRMACHNSRTQLEESLMAAKADFIGLSQEEIMAILGKPERQELYSRGQKFYIYFLTPSPECKQNQKEEADSTRFLYIRFSAINMVSELFIKHR